MIKIDNLSLMRGSKTLLYESQAVVYPGHKVGLVGANGAGKSSLFAMLLGQLSVDTGSCYFPKEWQIVSVAQETPASDKAAIDYVIDGDTRYRSLQKALDEAEQQGDGNRMAELHGLLEQHGVYDIHSRAATILAGLGFSQSQLNQPVTAFSGGWRMRLNLAQALLVQSDLLLLDEPTNHLDLDAVIWLEKWLNRYTGTLLLISHDRTFLDSCAASILSIEQQKLVSYQGNYSAFEKQKAEGARLQQSEYRKQQEKIAHLQAFVTRFKAKASKAKQAQSRVKQLEKMELILPAQQDTPFSFRFQPPDKLPNPLIYMEEVKLGYGKHTVLEQVKLNLVPGSRIGLLGRNGAGKSTLIKCLANELPPLHGEYNASTGLNIGYFAQHQLELLTLENSPLQHLQQIDRQAKEQSLRDFLGSFNFHGDQAVSAVAPFSGGEKARLVLALIMYQKPNLLLLDEPTNHLDMSMRDALNFALQAFEGAMVLVSHDRFLLASVCDDFCLVNNGQVSGFSGDLDDYQNCLFAQQKILSNHDAAAEGSNTQSSKTNRKDQKKREAAFRQQTKPLREIIQVCEKRITQLETDLEVVQSELALPDVYNEENKIQLMRLLDKQSELSAELQQQEDRWISSQQELEYLEQQFQQDDAS
jgi:ATP-binding cassette subfamily F protein 3